MNKNSIEETIKQLKLMLKVRKEQKEIIECAGGSCMNCNPDIKTLSESIDILSDYKKVLKENEELKSNNEKYIIHLTNEQYKTVIENAQNDINQKWIQKIKDKIEEYKNMLKTCNKAKDIDRIKAINERILELEELLEGRK